MRRGGAALRERLARPAALARVVAPHAQAIDVSGETVVAADPILPLGTAPAAAPDLPADAVAESGTPAVHLSLSAFDRILAPTRQRDRTFMIALLIVLFLHVGTLVSMVRLGADQPTAERMGQVDDPTSVAVELVTEPSKDAKSDDAQRGETAPPPPQPVADPKPPAPEQQPQEAQEAQKAQKAEKAEKAEKKPAEKAEPLPPSPDDDAMALADPDPSPREEAKPQEEKQPQVQVAPSQAAAPRQKIPGKAPNGHQSEYSKIVMNAIDDRWLLEFGVVKGEALVNFELSRSGTFKYIRVAQSSGNRTFDEHLIELIRSVRMPIPPAAIAEQELAYQIHFQVR